MEGRQEGPPCTFNNGSRNPIQCTDRRHAKTASLTACSPSLPPTPASLRSARPPSRVDPLPRRLRTSVRLPSEPVARACIHSLVFLGDLAGIAWLPGPPRAHLVVRSVLLCCCNFYAEPEALGCFARTCRRIRCGTGVGHRVIVARCVARTLTMHASVLGTIRGGN